MTLATYLQPEWLIGMRWLSGPCSCAVSLGTSHEYYYSQYIYPPLLHCLYIMLTLFLTRPSVSTCAFSCTLNHSKSSPSTRYRITFICRNALIICDHTPAKGCKASNPFRYYASATCRVSSFHCRAYRQPLFSYHTRCHRNRVYRCCGKMPKPGASKRLRLGNQINFQEVVPNPLRV